MKPTQKIRESVAAALPTDFGPVTSWRGPFHRDWSWHFHADTGGRRSTALVIKVPRWQDAPTLDQALEAGEQQDTRSEYQALVEIREAVAAAGDPGLAAVVPVGFVSEVNAIVLERLRARSLGERLGVGGGGEQAVTLFTRVGRWLRVFHDTCGWEPATFSAAAIDLADQPSRVADSVQAAQEAAQRLEGRVFAVGTQHGDLTLGNVLVTIDDRIAVIDPNRTTGALAADPARLLAEVRLGRRQLATRGLLRRPSVVDRWSEAIVAGHGGLDPTVVEFERGVAALRRWGDLERRDGIGAALRPVWRPMFRAETAARFNRV